MALPASELVQTRGELIELDAQAVWCDVAAFRQLLPGDKQETNRLRQAVDLYRGPFLAGFLLPNCVEFEHWVSLLQSTLERLYLEALETLIDGEIARQNYEQASRDAFRYLETDDLAEEIHRKLMALLAIIGDRNAALQQYERCLAALERELGISPLPETRAVYQLVLEGHTPMLAKPAQEVALDQPEQPGLVVPLLGREQALHSLNEALSQARAGQGNIVLISGESGIGKSRLMREFVGKVPPKVRVLYSSGYPGGQALPYKLIVDAIHSGAGILSPGVALQPVWLAELSRLLPELRSLYPDLPAALPAEPEDARLRLFEALSRFVLASLPAYPISLFCFDDMQWADRTTLEWLAYFGRQLVGKECRLLILASYREEDREWLADLRQGLERQAVLSEIKLSGLDEAAIQEILRSLRGQEIMDRALADRLHQATGGNPLFLLEVLGTLIEEHKLDALSELEDLPLPEGVREAVAVRLRHLDAKSSQLLDACAVLGPVFDFEWICLTAGRGEMETMDSLSMLVARRVINEEEGKYHFTHDLARQAVEAGMSPVRQQLLHRRAGRALEKLAPGSASELAYHFDRGGEPQKALHYHKLASQQAEKLFAWQEAEKHQTRILELLAQLDPQCSNPEQLTQRGEILASRAHLHFLQGHLAERDADLAALAVLAERGQNKVLHLQALQHLTRYLNLDGRYAEAIKLSEEGLALATRLDNLPACSRFLAQIGFAHYFLGQPRRAMTALESALALSGSNTDPERYGRIVHILGYVHFHLGNYARSQAYQQEAYLAHQRIGDTNRVAWDLIDIGSAHLQLGRYDEARHMLEQGVETARTIGARPAEAYGLYYLGWWELYQDHSSVAQEYFFEALSLQEALPVQHVTVSIETGLGLALYQSKKLAEAQRWLEKAAHQARSLGLRRRLSDALIGLALAELDSGTLSPAGSHLGEAIAAARASECFESLARGLVVLARCRRMSGDPAGALICANEAIEIAQQISVPTCEMWGELEAGLALLAQGKPTEALVRSVRAQTLLPQAHEGWIAKREAHAAHALILHWLGGNAH
jgi:tetratricopeptide (TPR) repeat protein